MLDLADWISSQRKNWDHPPTPDSLVTHRLAILRDLAFVTHRSKSEALTRQNHTKHESLIDLEAKLKTLRDLPGDKLAAFQIDEIENLQVKPEETSPPQEELVEKIQRVFSPEKLLRHDRKWELRLLLEALHTKLPIWDLIATVPLREAEDWNNRFKNELWPNGYLLFVDSLSSAQDLSQGAWKGCWHFVWAKDSSPDQSSAFVDSLDHQWKLLYNGRQ